MTDSEIIKALMCCKKGDCCHFCPLFLKKSSKSCISDLNACSLDLIKRQQAKIAETTKQFTMINCTDCPMPIKQVCERYGDKVEEIIRRINEEGKADEV